MAKSFVLTHGPGTTFLDNASYSLSLGGGLVTNLQSVDTDAEIPIRNAGTFRKLYAYVPTNTASVSTTITLRKSLANTALTLTYTSDQTGVKEDTSNSAAFANTDEACFKVVVPSEAGTNNITISLVAVEFEPDTKTECLSWLVVGGGVITENTASQTRFFSPTNRAQAASASVESTRLAEMRGAFTASNFYVFVASNARTTDTTFGTRVNTANGAQSVTYTSGQTGAKEDTANTDAIVAGDDLTYRITTSTGTNNLTLKVMSCQLLSTAGEFAILSAEQNGFAVTFNTTIYTAVGGDVDTEATQANSQFSPRTTYVAKEMTANVSGNTIATSDTTIHLMVGGSATGLTITYTAGQTGQKTDSTHSAVISGAGSDLIQHRIVTPNTSGTFTIQNIGMIVTGPQEVAGATIASGASAFAPTLKQVVVGAFIAAASSLTAPTISTGAQSVTGAHIASTASVTAPTLAYKIAGAHIASGATLTAPTLRYAVAGATIASGATVNAPTVGYRVQLPTIASGATLTAPTISPGAVNVSGAHIAAGATLTAPTLAYKIVGAHIASGATQNAPTVSPGAVSVSGVFIASNATLTAPTIAPGAASVAGAHIASAATMTSPSLTAGAVSVTTAHIASVASLSPPTVTQGVTIVTVVIPSTAQLFAPTVIPGAVTVAGATIPSGSTLSSPRLSYAVVGATIPVGSQLFAPTVRYAVTGATMASTSTLSPPSVTVGAPTILLAHLASTAVLFAPTVDGGVTLDLGCMTNRSLTPRRETVSLMVVRDTRNLMPARSTECGCECED